MIDASDWKYEPLVDSTVTPFSKGEIGVVSCQGEKIKFLSSMYQFIVGMGM